LLRAELFAALERHILDNNVMKNFSMDYLSELLFSMVQMRHTPSTQFVVVRCVHAAHPVRHRAAAAGPTGLGRSHGQVYWVFVRF
jgi:hypothetical protein